MLFDNVYYWVMSRIMMASFFLVLNIEAIRTIKINSVTVRFL